MKKKETSFMKDSTSYKQWQIQVGFGWGWGGGSTPLTQGFF